MTPGMVHGFIYKKKIPPNFYFRKIQQKNFKSAKKNFFFFYQRENAERKKPRIIVFSHFFLQDS